MSSHVVWEMDSAGELVRPLFVGSEVECCEIAPALYEVAIELADPTWWKSVVVQVFPNEGATWCNGGIIEEGEFAWFRDNGGDLIWGEVSRVVDAGQFVDEVEVADCSVVFDSAYILQADHCAVDAGSWCWDLAKCFGAGSVGLVAL